MGDYNKALKSLIDCGGLLLNEEQIKLRDRFSAWFGFSEFYEDWSKFETKNIIFYYRKDRNIRTDIEEFITLRQAAFEKIQGIFGSII